MPSLTESERTKRNQGMNWLSKPKRLAIYARDGFACAYCGRGAEEGVKLTLDHIIPFPQSHSNHQNNLLTACHSCNSQRGDKPHDVYYAQARVDRGHEPNVEEFRRYVDTQRQQPLDTAAAKQWLARRHETFPQVVKRTATQVRRALRVANTPT